SSSRQLRGLGHPDVVVAEVEVGDLVVARPTAPAPFGQPFEIALARRAGGEMEEHRGRLARLVAKAVDAAHRDVDEVARLALAPLPPVEDPDPTGQDVERFGDRAVEMGPGPTRLWSHDPAIEAVRALRRGARREVVGGIAAQIG